MTPIDPPPTESEIALLRELHRQTYQKITEWWGDVYVPPDKNEMPGIIERLLPVIREYVRLHLMANRQKCQFCDSGIVEPVALPWHWRVYFFGRRKLVRALKAAISFGFAVRCPSLVAAARSVQRRLGLRFER